MRPDMIKVLTERPRAGSSDRYERGKKKNKPELDDNAPIKASMSRYRSNSYNHKELTDHLSPIRRWLSSNCGRPWNKIYSEMKKNLSGGGLAIHHLMTHLDSEIVMHTKVIDGVLYSNNGYERPIKEHWCRFYVHNGLLYENKDRRTKYRWKDYKQSAPKIKRISKYQQYHYIGGIWYLLTLQDFTGKEIYYTNGNYTLNYILNDNTHILEKGIDFNNYSREELFGNKNYYVVKKVQLSKRDIKKNKLDEIE